LKDLDLDLDVGRGKTILFFSHKLIKQMKNGPKT
jgi:hypothetical protein